MDRRVTPPKRVTSPIWGTLPPCKQTLSVAWKAWKLILTSPSFSSVDELKQPEIILCKKFQDFWHVRKIMKSLQNFFFLGFQTNQVFNIHLMMFFT